MKTVVSIKAQLRNFSAVNARFDVAEAALEKSLRSFGRVDRVECSNFNDALRYLLPVKSLATRFLILGLDGWSLLLADMRGENCYVDAFAISRATLCNAISLSIEPERRELYVFEEEQKLRVVQSLSDGKRWYYREEGLLQPFEESEECSRRPKSSRLQPQALERYFTRYTGLEIPRWKNEQYDRIIGLERSTRGLTQPVRHFDTADDR